MSSSAGEQRIVLRDVSLDVYQTVSDAMRAEAHVHAAYDGRDLEIMTTGAELGPRGNPE
jgi:hypothetical protein